MAMNPIIHVMSGIESDNKGTSNLDNQIIIEEKEVCKDDKSEKTCQKLKKKNKGKGCKKNGTKKKCKKTCGLCKDGRSSQLGIIYCLCLFSREFLSRVIKIYIVFRLHADINEVLLFLSAS